MKFINYIIPLILSATAISCNQQSTAVPDSSLTISSNETMDLKLTTIINMGMLDFRDTSFVVSKTNAFILSEKTNDLTLCFLQADDAQTAFYIGSESSPKITINQNDQGITSFSFDTKDLINIFTDKFHNQLAPLFESNPSPTALLKHFTETEIKLLGDLEKIKPVLNQKSYAVLYDMVTGKIAHLKFIHSEEYDAISLDSTYYDFTNNMIFDDAYLTYSDNLNTVLGVVSVQYYRKHKKEFDQATPEDKFDFVNNLIENKEVKSSILAFLAGSLIPELSMKEKEVIIAQLSKMPISNRYMDHVKAVKAETAVGKKKGNKAEFFETLTPYNKDFEVAKLQGKMIYVDHWATWCGPCMKSQAIFKEKYKNLKNQDDITFIFVSFDRSEEKWRESVKNSGLLEKNIVHLYNGPEMKSDYGKFYNITSLPSYLTLDKQGFIFDIDPKHPQDDDFEKYLDGLLN